MGEKVNTLLQAVNQHEATRQSGVPQLLDAVPSHIVMVRLPSRDQWRHQYRLTLGGLRAKPEWEAHSKALKVVDASRSQVFSSGKSKSQPTDRQSAQAAELEFAARIATGRVLELAAGAYQLTSDQETALREARDRSGSATELLGQFRRRLDSIGEDAGDGAGCAEDPPSFHAVAAGILDSSVPLPDAEVAGTMRLSDAFAAAVVERYLDLSSGADRAITDWAQAGAARLGKASGGTEPAVPSGAD